MRKELEALERLKSSLKSYCYEFTSSMEDLERGLFEKDYEAVKVIETALKDYETLKLKDEEIKEYKSYSHEQFVQERKQLKALEIIKEKQVNVLMIKLTCKTVEEYNHLIQPKWRTLTQEEFDLLKEVLL